MNLLTAQIAPLSGSSRRDGNDPHFLGIADETSRTAGSGAASLTAKGTKMLCIFEGGGLKWAKDAK